jgi:ABC-type transporter Mla MlaB component
MKQTKRKRKAAPDAPSENEPSEQSTIVAPQSVAPAAADVQAAAYALGPSCTMRDGGPMKTALLQLVNAEQPVAVDVSAVERIDTSALQLLCAFVHDRRIRGRATRWTGHAPVFSEAVAILGLGQALSYTSSHISGPRA